MQPDSRHPPSSRADLGYASVLVLAVGLRLFLALWNLQANDDHVQVVRRILDGELPRNADCWQCYQPKLFHALCAGLCSVLGEERLAAQWLICQLLNVAFGTGTLVLLLLLVRRKATNPVAGILCFAVVALAPNFVGINAQATNDSAMIFLGALAIYGLWRFVETERLAHLAMSLAGALFANEAKGTGIGLFTFVSVYLVAYGLVRWWAGTLGRREVAAFLVCQALFLLYWPYSSYARNAADRGSVLAINTRYKPVAPRLFEKEFLPHAGLRSVAEGLGTFHYFGMLAEPYIRPGAFNYPEHRRSLWSVVYGLHFFSRFAYHPQSWRTDQPLPLAVGRIALALGIVPVVLLLLGGCRRIWLTARTLWRDGPGAALAAPDTVLLLSAAVFVAILVIFVLQYRAYTSMKSIHVYPALLGFAGLLLDGLAPLWRKRALRGAVIAVLLVLCMAHVADTALLGRDLARRHDRRAADLRPQNLPDR